MSSAAAERSPRQVLQALRNLIAECRRNKVTDISVEELEDAVNAAEARLS